MADDILVTAFNDLLDRTAEAELMKGLTGSDLLAGGGGTDSHNGGNTSAYA